MPNGRARAGGNDVVGCELKRLIRMNEGLGEMKDFRLKSQLLNDVIIKLAGPGPAAYIDSAGRARSKREGL